jgi:hypothetical protein
MPIEQPSAFCFICSQCEDLRDPVTFENGRVVYYRSEEIHIEVYLHYRCAMAWSEEIGLPLPPEMNTVVQ